MSLNQLILLYMWFATTAILLFLLIIARFYEQFSGKKTHYRWVILVIIGFGIGFIRYAEVSVLLGDMPGDLILGSSGLFLIGFSSRLFWMMVINR